MTQLTTNCHHRRYRLCHPVPFETDGVRWFEHSLSTVGGGRDPGRAGTSSSEVRVLPWADSRRPAMDGHRQVALEWRVSECARWAATKTCVILTVRGWSGEFRELPRRACPVKCVVAVRFVRLRHPRV